MMPQKFILRYILDTEILRNAIWRKKKNVIFKFMILSCTSEVSDISRIEWLFSTTDATDRLSNENLAV